VKFTPPGGRVQVQLTCDMAGLRLCVADTGVGIPAEERFPAVRALLPRLEHPQLGDRDRPRWRSGRTVVERHGGTITVNDNGHAPGPPHRPAADLLVGLLAAARLPRQRARRWPFWPVVGDLVTWSSRTVTRPRSFAPNETTRAHQDEAVACEHQVPRSSATGRNEKRRLRNKSVKSALKTAIRKFNEATVAGDTETAGLLLP